MSELKEKEAKKIEVTCCDCGKKFNTTQDWFDTNNKDGKLQCRACRVVVKTTINKNAEKDDTKIEVNCCSCGKKIKTTQGWFNTRNKDGKLPCRACRT